MGTDIILWGAATPRTMRAHWALHELGIVYQSELIGSRSGALQKSEFVQLNPKKKIPVLVDGDFVLSESAAIVTYLGDHYGSELQLTPPFQTRERARFNEWSHFIMMELDATSLYIIRKHRGLAELYGEAPAAIDAAIANFDKQVRVAEIALDQERNYLLGETFSGVDILLTTCLDAAEFFDVALSDRLRRYANTHRQRPAYQKAHELNYSITSTG